jgi:2-polyprenyl-3-methyl-5-hydroxy-6-metoxy-1,4-benzoquinol methylase
VLHNADKSKNSLRRWLGYAKWQLSQHYRQLIYGLPLPGSKRFIHGWWEEQALMIHEHWGSDEHDYAVISQLLVTYQPHAVLDVGCGSGRLFKLYQQHGVETILGIDISEQALAIARQRFPQIPTLHGPLEELKLPAERFDLAICNRVLQHIPPYAIRRVITILCTSAQRVYVNELTTSDHLAENFYMRHHDYPALFAEQNYQLLERGQLAEQTYQVYGASEDSL